MKRLCLVVVAGVMAMAGAGRAQVAAVASGPFGIRQGVPAGVEVVVEVSRQEFFLGENILLQFGVRNRGTEVIRVETGGDYRGASRALRFQVRAVDAAGKEMADPDPSGFNMGGLSGPSEIKPGETFWEGLPLIRYRRLDVPGVYTVTVKHDLGWGVPVDQVPGGTVQIKLVMPTAEQAGKVVAEMAGLKNDGSWSKSQKRPEFADYAALRYPVYLPILAEGAAGGKAEMCAGIGAMETREATAALVELLGSARAEVALAAAQNLTMRLPDPDFDGKGPLRGAPFADPRREQRRLLWEASWRPEFAPAVRKAGREFLGGDDVHQAIGAFMLECLGTRDDLGVATVALERVILSSKTRVWKENDFPSGPEHADALERAVRQMVKRGGVVPANPKGPGEQAVVALAVNGDEQVRPAGWEGVFGAMLASEVPYQRQQAVMLMPVAAAAGLEGAIERALGDGDLGVVCRALELVGRVKGAHFGPAVLKILRSDRREWVLSYADQAAWELKLTPQTYRIWADRLGEAGMAQEAMKRLVGLIEGTGGWGWNGNVPADVTGVQRAWREFVAGHEKEIEAGKKFAAGKEGGITEGMIPRQMTVTVEGKTWPVRGGE